MSDRLVPLKVVCFERPTSVPGTKVMLTTIVAKVRMLPDGVEYVTPQPFLDPETGEVYLEHSGETRVYPPMRVHYYVRSKMALSKDPPPLDTDYTIGKREPKRIVVTVLPKAKA